MGSHAITYAVVALAIAAVCLMSGFVWGRSNVKTQVEDAVEKEHVALDAREFSMRTQLEDAIAEIAKLRPVAEELGRVQKRLEREQSKFAQMRAEFNATMGIAPEPSVEADSDGDPDLLQASESADDAIQKLLQSLDVFNVPNAEVPAFVPLPDPPAPKPPPPAAQAHLPVRPAPIQAALKPAELPQAVKVPQPLPPTPASIQPPPVRPTPSTPQKSEPLKPVQSNPSRLGLPSVPPKSVPAPAAVPATPAAAPASVQTRPILAEQPKSGQKQVDEWQKFARELEALTGKKK